MGLRRTTSLVLFPLLVGGGVAACGPPSDTVIVEVCGDVQIPTDIDALRVSIMSADRTEYRAGTLDLLNCGGVPLTLPHTIEIEAPVGDVWVAVTGLQSDLEVMRSERRLEVKDSGPAQEAFLSLTRSCMRVTCAVGQACIDGLCEQVPWPDTELSCSGGPPSAGAGGGTKVCPAEGP